MRAPPLRRLVQPLLAVPRAQLRWQHVAPAQTHTELQPQQPNPEQTSDIAFCFDIDGVLLRSSKPIPGAIDALKTLQAERIPFIFLTNGGGTREKERIADLSEKLSIPLDPSMLVQSHTLYGGSRKYDELKHQCVLVVGGNGAKCREVAESYGYTNVVTPGDIYAAHPEIWPFSKHFTDYYRSFARPLPKPINPAKPNDSLRIDAVFVYNDPRDWGLDIQLLVDLMLSHKGILGTISSKNGNASLENCGYLQDNQPVVYFSNPDITWASEYPQPRLGQGAFRSALTGVWKSVVSGHNLEYRLPIHFTHYEARGKPNRASYVFAEHKLNRHRAELLGPQAQPLKTVFMVGDNPNSDIEGANMMAIKPRWPIEWVSVLTRTGVFTGQLPDKMIKHPKFIVKDVAEAVALGLSYNKKGPVLSQNDRVKISERGRG